jgi:hypothetical protein
MVRLGTFQRGPFCLVCGRPIKNKSLRTLLTAFVLASRSDLALVVICPRCPHPALGRVVSRPVENAA